MAAAVVSQLTRGARPATGGGANAETPAIHTRAKNSCVSSQGSGRSNSTSAVARAGVARQQCGTSAGAFYRAHWPFGQCAACSAKTEVSACSEGAINCCYRHESACARRLTEGK